MVSDNGSVWRGIELIDRNKFDLVGEVYGGIGSIGVRLVFFYSFLYDKWCLYFWSYEILVGDDVGFSVGGILIGNFLWIFIYNLDFSLLIMEYE